eukprot:CFRG4295T1
MSAELLPKSEPFNRKHFATKGYAVAKQFLTTDQIEHLSRASARCAPNLDLKSQFHERDDPHRYEYMLFECGFETTFKPLVDHLVQASLPKLEKLFGPSVKLTVESGLCPGDAFCIVSEQGSKDQVWHTDSVPIPGHFDVAKWCSTLHYVGFLVPLVNTTEKVGRTEILPGSHLGAEHTKPARALSMSVGDVLVLDGRTHHRGLGNTSGPLVREGGGCDNDCVENVKQRQICFFTFKLPSLVDANAAAYAVEQQDQKPVNDIRKTSSSVERKTTNTKRKRKDTDGTHKSAITVLSKRTKTSSKKKQWAIAKL